MAHEAIEKNVGLMAVLIIVVISLGGLAQIVPLMFRATMVEPAEGVEVYSPTRLAGRDIYVREGCYNCHSQMVRPFRDEVERYGHYSLAAESMYDHPFQWGSKRTGPDLARVGGKYSDEWHSTHLIDPRSLVPESVMPGYPFLAKTPLKYTDIAKHLETNRMVGVPYDDAMIEAAMADLEAQVNPDADGVEAMQERYPGAQARNFDGQPGKPTEMDALISYLQVLGTMVDFSSYKAEENYR